MDDIKPLEEYEAELRKTLKNTFSRESMLPAGRILVDIRRHHFITPRGDADLQGRSFAYREWHGQFMRETFPDEKKRKSVGARLRYAVGVALREMLTPEELEAAGLQKIGPKERIAKNNAQRAEAYKLLNHQIENFADASAIMQLLDRSFNEIRDQKTRKWLAEALNALSGKILEEYK